eukprot:12533656-Alexandrium_andersonii.AAC.1
MKNGRCARRALPRTLRATSTRPPRRDVPPRSRIKLKVRSTPPWRPLTGLQSTLAGPPPRCHARLCVGQLGGGLPRPRAL